MARCLVTGHRGYVGSRLFEELKRLGHEVMGIDIKDGYDINSHLGLKEDDDGNFYPLWYNFQPEYIFHLACYPRVGYSIENPVMTTLNNVMAGTNVLNFARKVGASRVIYSSSSSIKGNGHGPTSPYALQKMMTEIECRLYSELYNLETVALRYFNVYSEDQEASGAYATAVSNWMSYIRKNKTPFITGTGSQRRDMLHIKDAVAANIFAMEYEGNFDGSHYDVGTGKNISLNEVKDIVLKHFKDLHFMYVSPRPNEVAETLASVEKLESLGWKANITILDGVERCFEKLSEDICSQ